MGGRAVRFAVAVCLVTVIIGLVTIPASARPPFKDMNGNPAWDAVNNLARLGIVRGCDPPDFDYYCPEDPTLRHQMAALVVRAMPGWQDQAWTNSFSDPTDDAELWRRVGTLAHYGVVVGYQPEVCQARGNRSPCYGPLDSVTYGQALLFITRAMVAQGYWSLEDDDRLLYPQQNGSSGANPNTDQQTLDHRMLVTFQKHIGTPRDVFSSTFKEFRVIHWRTSVTYGWEDPATRGWFARVLWQVLSEYPGGVLPTPGSSPTPTPSPSAYPSPSSAPSPSANPSPSGFNPAPYLGQGDKYNCADFTSQANAQSVLRADPRDPNQLDQNRDGIACESNPAPKDLTPVPRP